MALADLLGAALSEAEMTTLSGALWVAAERYDSDALEMAALYAFDLHSTDFYRLAEQFVRQAQQARALLLKLET